MTSKIMFVSRYSIGSVFAISYLRRFLGLGNVLVRNVLGRAVLVLGLAFAVGARFTVGARFAVGARLAVGVRLLGCGISSTNSACSTVVSIFDFPPLDMI